MELIAPNLKARVLGDGPFCYDVNVKDFNRLTHIL